MLGKMLSRRAIPLLKGGFTIAGYGVFGGARIACGVLWKAVDVRAFAVHLNMYLPFVRFRDAGSSTCQLFQRYASVFNAPGTVPEAIPPHPERPCGKVQRNATRTSFALVHSRGSTG